MPPISLNPESSVVALVDIQPTFLKAIHEADRVLQRSLFLARFAQLFGVPVLATEQNPERLGPTDAALLPFAGTAWPKMTFSMCGCEPFMNALRASGRKQVYLVGIETHICVTQTTIDLLKEDFDVIACVDALSARSADMHQAGLQRIINAGAIPSHTESVAYEWMGTAEHPKFRDALKIVKG